MKIHIVLVRTEYASNIGAAARALANMGGDRLILVDPRCDIDLEARKMAAGTQETLRRSVRYKDWQEFYTHEGDGLRVALTRRGGRKRRVFALEEKVLTFKPKQNLYLIFGPEADGLDSEDLAFVNYACHLPVYGPFGSLNLAQAVLLALFIVRQKHPPTKPAKQIKGEIEEPIQPFYFPDQLIKEWLTAMGFDIKARRASAYLTLKKLFLQNLPTRHEVQVLEAILQQNIRKLKGKTSAGLALKKVGDDFGKIPGK